MGAVVAVGLVVDSGGLRVAVPGLDFRPAGGALRFVAGAVGADEVDRRLGAVSGDQIAAVTRVFGGWHDEAGDIEAFPPVALEDRRPHRNDVVLREDVDDLVEVLKILDVELVEVTGGQVLEADVESLVLSAVAWTDSAHVGLHGHQQGRVEAFGLPVAGVRPNLIQRRPPGQRPGGVADEDCRCAIGMNQIAVARRHPPEAVLLPRDSGWCRRRDDVDRARVR